MFGLSHIKEDDIAIQKVDNDYPVLVTANNVVGFIEKNDNIVIFLDNELVQGILGDKRTIKEFGED